MTHKKPMTLPLEKISVLITRPLHQAQTLYEKINALGGHAILLPTIEIADIEASPALQKIIDALQTYHIAIFISPNAVLKTLPLLANRAWPNTVKVAAIGAGTAKALRDNHLPVDYYPEGQFNSEAFLAMQALQEIRGKKIILFRGDAGRTKLAHTLRKRGASLTEAVIYRRLCPAMPSVQQPIHADIMICTSNTGLKNLVQLYGQHNRQLLSTPLLVVSRRIAEFARTLNFVKPALIADNASDPSIVKTLISWQETTHGI